MPILQDLTGKVDCPVFYGLPFGHELPFFCTSGMQELTVSPR
jgi:muramoyltetrapeptide carboxypeptidase LdcA involved in peptidoglycan recycling